MHRSGALWCILLLLVLLLPPLAGRASAADGLETLFAQDRRLASVANGLLVANAPLCPSQMPSAGMILHSRDQYRGDWADPLFTQGPLAIAQVLPGSVAAMADLRSGDGVTAIAGQRPVASDGTLRMAALALLRATWHPDEELRLEIMRDGTPRSVVLHPAPACLAVVEIGTDGGLSARTDGHVISVPLRLVQAATDTELAVIVAHELGHVILQHRRRLEAAGVDKGLLGEFGRNRRLSRQAEVEADRLSVHLLANAGHDPASAPAFWRGELGRRVGGGLLRHRAYPSPEQRAEILDNEIAGHLAGAARFHDARHLVTLRDQPIASGD